MLQSVHRLDERATCMARATLNKVRMLGYLRGAEDAFGRQGHAWPVFAYMPEHIQEACQH